MKLATFLAIADSVADSLDRGADDDTVRAALFTAGLDGEDLDLAAWRVFNQHNGLYDPIDAGPLLTWEQRKGIA